MHRRCKGRTARLLHPQQTLKVKVIAAARRPPERVASGDHERSARNAVQTLIGSRCRREQRLLVEIDCLRTEAAHRIHQKTDAVAQPPLHRLRIDGLQPLAGETLVCDRILGAYLRDALAVYAVLRDQKPALRRHQSGDHALDCTGAGRRHQHCAPGLVRQTVDLQQPHARFILKIEEFALAVAQIRLQHAAADTFAQGNGTRVEQQHQTDPKGIKCRIQRVLSAAGP